MRIGYLTYGLDRAPTGIGRYSSQLLDAMASLSNAPEIVLLTSERADSHGLWSRFERHALPGSSRLPAFMLVASATLGSLARTLKLDLIHDPNGIAPFAGPARHARRIVTIHDAFAYVYPENHKGLDNWRYRHHLPAAARNADAIITVSECSRNDLSRFLGADASRLHVIPEGVDEQFRPVEDGDARSATLRKYGIDWPYILYVGGINGRKNIARLFEAFAAVRGQFTGLRLVIVGKRQWQTGGIDAAFRRHQLENDVHFTGYVADADLPSLYSAAQLFVFPSLYEGFGLPPLEAMACGCPVVTSNTASLPEVVGDAAIVVDPYDVAGIAASICHGLESPDARAELRRRGLARAARFRWVDVAHQTLEVYGMVLAAGRITPQPASSGRA